MKFISSRFSIIFTGIVFAALLFTSGYTNVLYGDAGGYWQLATSFYKHFSHTEHFSFYNFNNPLRGYLFPLTLLPAFVFCHFTKIPPFVVTKVAGVFWAAMLFGWVLPSFWHHLTGWPLRRSAASVGLLAGFAAWSWGSYFAYPLTDFPAVTLLLLALLWLRTKTVRAWLLAGIAFAAALNFRPLYLAAAPGVALLLLVEAYRFRQAITLRVLGFGLGAGLVLVPQILLNIHNFQYYSPLVMGRSDVHNPHAYSRNSPHISLYRWHLAKGMQIQKLEASLYDASDTVKVVVTRDPQGQRLLLQATAGRAFASGQQYAGVVARHPVEFTALFARRLFCNLYTSCPSPYLQKPAGKGTLFFLVNFSVIFFGIIMLKRIRFALAALFQLGALLCVVAAALPLVVEPRFMMPLHLLLMVAATCGATPGAWWRLLRAKPAVRYRLAAAYGSWLLGCLLMSSIADSQTHLEAASFFQ